MCVRGWTRAGLSRAPKVSEVLGSIVVPATEVGLSATFQRPKLEPLIESGIIEAVKATKGRLDVGLEMVDLQTLDYGQHRAAVVQDLGDKLRITGFFKLARLIVQESATSNASDNFGLNPGSVQFWSAYYPSSGTSIYSAIAASPEGTWRTPSTSTPTCGWRSFQTSEWRLRNSLSARGQ